MNHGSCPDAPFKPPIILTNPRRTHAPDETLEYNNHFQHSDPQTQETLMILLQTNFGDRLTFMGGISRFVAEMSSEELETHLRDVYDTAYRCRGFIPSEEGGIPKNMSPDNFQLYLRLHDEFGHPR